MPYERFTKFFRRSNPKLEYSVLCGQVHIQDEKERILFAPIIIYIFTFTNKKNIIIYFINFMRFTYIENYNF